MNQLRFLLLVATFVVIAAGCASGDSAPEESVEPEEAVGSSASEEPVVEAAPGQFPEGIPDRNEDPAGFWTWRVDQMFINRDTDEDGKISRDEFSGNPAEFDVMDVDKDGLLAKREVEDHVFARFVVPQTSSTD